MAKTTKQEKKSSLGLLEKILKNAMKFRLRLQREKEKISYVDAIGYQYALENNLKFVTSDPAFKKLENAEFIPEKE